VPYLSASAVVIHYEEALYQVCAPLPLPLPVVTTTSIILAPIKSIKETCWYRLIRVVLKNGRRTCVIVVHALLGVVWWIVASGHRCLWPQVTGCVLVGVGIWQHAHRDRLWYGALLTTAAGPTDAGSETTTTTGDQSLDRTTSLLVGVGTLLLVVSFLGCCGACADSVCFLGFVSRVSISFPPSSSSSSLLNNLGLRFVDFWLTVLWRVEAAKMKQQ